LGSWKPANQGILYVPLPSHASLLFLGDLIQDQMASPAVLTTLTGYQFVASCHKLISSGLSAILSSVRSKQNRRVSANSSEEKIQANKQQLRQFFRDAQLIHCVSSFTEGHMVALSGLLSGTVFAERARDERKKKRRGGRLAEVMYCCVESAATMAAALKNLQRCTQLSEVWSGLCLLFVCIETQTHETDGMTVVKDSQGWREEANWISFLLKIKRDWSTCWNIEERNKKKNSTVG
ncbi:unnamed protein product, partial [Pleuronectes platessa]